MEEDENEDNFPDPIENMAEVFSKRYEKDQRGNTIYSQTKMNSSHNRS